MTEAMKRALDALLGAAHDARTFVLAQHEQLDDPPADMAERLEHARQEVVRVFYRDDGLDVSRPPAGGVPVALAVQLYSRLCVMTGLAMGGTGYPHLAAAQFAVEFCRETMAWVNREENQPWNK